MNSVLQEVLAKRPPPTLFHYTGHTGLIGIVKTGYLWASKIQFLNDASELHYGLKIARSELRLRAKNATVQIVGEILALLENNLERFEAVNVCVACFCEDGNLLSQWRAYSKGTTGYAIGFDSNLLSLRCADQQFTLLPCVYEPNSQRQLLGEAIENALDRVQAFGSDIARLTEEEKEAILTKQVGLFMADLMRRLPIIKNASFAEEREWRVVSGLVSSRSPHFAVHSTPTCLIPHFNFQLRDTQGKLQIPDFMCGPNPLGVAALDGVHILFEQHNVEWRGMRPSNIPYRQL